MISFCPRYVEPRIIVRRVPRGTRGTLVTARLIAQLIREGAKDFYVRQKAVEIFRVYGARAKDRFARSAPSSIGFGATSATRATFSRSSCCTRPGG